MGELTELFSLSGKTAIVTGASRGIGRAIAAAFAEAGAVTYGLARSERPSPPLPASVRYRRADVTGGIGAVIAGIAEEVGGLDVLVNAAGISLGAPPAGSPPEAALDVFERTLAANLTAAYAAAHAAIAAMKPGGSIINVSSINAHQGFPGNPGYVASKGGLRALTKALAVDFGPRGVRVNCLAPGYVHTDMTAASFGDPERHAARAAHTCLGRWGEPEDMVGGAVFLASAASAYMTGQDLIIDGGWTAKGL